MRLGACLMSSPWVYIGKDNLLNICPVQAIFQHLSSHLGIVATMFCPMVCLAIASFVTQVATASVVSPLPSPRDSTHFQRDDCWHQGGRRMIHTGNGTWIRDDEACKGELSSFLLKATPYGGTSSTKSKRDNNCSGTAEANCGPSCQGSDCGNQVPFYYNPQTANCQSFAYTGCCPLGNIWSVAEESTSACSGNTLQINGYTDTDCSNFESSYTTHLDGADSFCAAQLNYISWLVFATS